MDSARAEWLVLPPARAFLQVRLLGRSEKPVHGKTFYVSANRAAPGEKMDVLVLFCFAPSRESLGDQFALLGSRRVTLEEVRGYI